MLLEANNAGLVLPDSPRGLGLPQNFVVPDGLVVYWGMGGDCTTAPVASAGSSLDLTEQGRDLTLSTTGIGYPYLKDAPTGQGLFFNGTDAYASFPSTNFPILGTGPRSACFWVNVADFTNYSGPIELGQINLNGARFAFYIMKTTAPYVSAVGRLSAEYTGVTVFEDSASVPAMATNTWYHYAITEAAGTISATQTTIYRNAVKSAVLLTGSTNINMNTTSSPSHFISGSDNGAGGVTVMGPTTYSDFRIYNRLISQGEIREIYSSGLNQIRSYKFNQDVLGAVQAVSGAILFARSSL